MEINVLLLIGILNLIVVFFLTLSGGIGLVMRPIIIFLGIPPQVVLGTSRVSSFPGGILSLAVLSKSKKIDWKLGFLLSIPSLIGGFLAIYLVVNLNEELLNKLIGILLFFSAIIFLLNRDLGVKRSVIKFSKFISNVVAFPAVLVFGFLLIIVGGSGSLYNTIFVLLYGKTYIEAAATRKLISVIQTVITSFILIYYSIVDWLLLISLIVSSMLGNYFGTRYAIKKGDEYLRILVLIISFVSSIKLMFF